MRWLKEPLLHFLIIGAGIFLLLRVLVRNTGSSQAAIAVTVTAVVLAP